MRRARLYFSFAALIWLVSLIAPVAGVASGEASPVVFWRLPKGGIQPQAAVDSKGVVHLIYFVAETSEGAGNLYYMRLAPNQTRPSEPIRVNDEADSAGSIGTVRTAQLTIGRGDRVHVVWNGLGPKGANGYPTAYEAYARLNDDGSAFERRRNLITWAAGIDGGGSVAADRDGNVYVAWHAMARATTEAGRAVFVTRSTDDGATFSKEIQANPEPTGACACCGMRALVDSSGVLYILYRSATDVVKRDTMLLVSRNKGQSFVEKRLQRWNIGVCPMSTYTLAESKTGIAAAWETAGRVYYATINPTDLSVTPPRQAVGASQKHPFLATGANGRTLLVWAEDTGWQRGGSLAWQVMGSDGAVATNGRKPEAIPVWGLASAYARPDGTFVIIY